MVNFFCLKENGNHGRKKNGGEITSNQKGKTSAGGGSHCKTRGRGNGRRGRGNASNTGNKGGNNSGGRDKSHIRCYNCDEMGHYSTQCKASSKKKVEANLTQSDTELALLLTVLEERSYISNTLSHHQEEVPLQDSGSPVLENPRPPQDCALLIEDHILPELYQANCVSPPSTTWYLDNGASNYMTGDRNKFENLDERYSGSVKFGDGSSVKIHGKGTIVFGCRNGEQWTLEEVYYIPSLCSNLVSWGQLTESGHKVVIDEDELEVFYKDPCRLIMKVKRSLNRLYKIELNQALPICLLSSISDLAWLWHARLGHVNFNALKLLADKKMAGGVPLITHPQQVCQDCLAGKQSRFSFPASTNYRASKPLELIHADLCGPISPATIGGSHYFMLLVDDFSRWMWIYVIKTKNQALLMFDKFKRLVENSQNRCIKILRTDRGGEFLSTNFTRLCEDAGIDRQYTTPYTPQQNGVVERRNRTVVGMARSLLKSMSVPGEFWGEAVRQSVHLLNRLPTKALGSRTPLEIWHGKKPHLGHLRVFGCTGHVKVITPNLKKLDERSIPMVYLGVEDGSKAHRLFNPHKGAIHVSRDVIFEENMKWNWNLDDGRSSGFEVEEPKTQAVSRMPIVAIDTYNNAIGGGSQNPATSTTASISPSRILTETAEEEDLNEGPIRY